MEFCRDGSVIYAPHEHDKAQRAIACVQDGYCSYCNQIQQNFSSAEKPANH